MGAVRVRGEAIGTRFAEGESMRTRTAAALFAVSALFLAPIADAKGTPAFDRDAATKVLSAVELIKCKAPGGPRGPGHVLVTFSPEGNVADVQVDRTPYAGNPVARCLVSQFKTAAKIPAFSGQAVTVGKNFSID